MPVRHGLRRQAGNGAYFDIEPPTLVKFVVLVHGNRWFITVPRDGVETSLFEIERQLDNSVDYSWNMELDSITTSNMLKTSSDWARPPSVFPFLYSSSSCCSTFLT